jgi:hypothetical protein
MIKEILDTIIPNIGCPIDREQRIETINPRLFRDGCRKVKRNIERMKDLAEVQKKVEILSSKNTGVARGLAALQNLDALSKGFNETAGEF